MINKRDYTGKTVYMGIDVHKKTYSCVSISENEIVKRDTMSASSEVLLNYMNKFFGGLSHLQKNSIFNHKMKMKKVYFEPFSYKENFRF